MAQPEQPKPTQRAYTFRLRGVSPEDTTWREALWRTHEAVNHGAKVFGDWLLTLRGGLDHTLAQTKDQRILLALSWLSVESQRGAPQPFIVTTGQDKDKEQRADKVVVAFREILIHRNLTSGEISEWVQDCQASLSAAIRDDAVWVNRSQAFDVAVKRCDGTLTRAIVWDMLGPFFGSEKAYLDPIKGSGEEDDSETGQSSGDKAKDLVQAAGQWLSSRFGTGKGADFAAMAPVYEKIALWASSSQVASNRTGSEAIGDLAHALGTFGPQSFDLQGVLGLISGPGYKSATRNLLAQIDSRHRVAVGDLEALKDKAAEDASKSQGKVGTKGRRPYSDLILKQVESVCGFTYLQLDGPASHSEFAVMLDHAARRVSLAHTWIKRAEAERRQFEADARKIADISSAVKNWLDAFCEQRSGSSGALEPYRIRKRAVSGWKEVAAAWNRAGCTTMADRIAAARALQDDPNIDKFGDIQLFEALAEDEALCVWNKGHQPLLDYAGAMEAESKKRRFKVPAYRHPDALLHPVFCDFGNSRWSIEFAVHQQAQAASKRNRRQQPVDPRGVTMTLCSGQHIQPVMLRWQSKRMARDFAFERPDQTGGDRVGVARADRLGRTAASVSMTDAVRITGLLEQPHWNGRLQAPRKQLEAIAAVRDGDSDPLSNQQRIAQMKEQIRWLVTFSAELQPQGPWCDLAQQLDLSIDPKYWPHVDQNKGRKGDARLVLSRLPGLRLLSVDLGHRYAAACAVWQAVSGDDVMESYAAAHQPVPSSDALWLHLKGGDNKTTIYRRIGADTLPDGQPHPAPWAKLERQFLIKLQGEQEGARKASPEELANVRQLKADIGFMASDEERIKKPSQAVDVLMSDTVALLVRALKRHGDRARIAFAMTATYRIRPGDRKEPFNTLDQRIEFLQEALLLWHGLIENRDWPDKEALRLWQTYIAKLPSYQPLVSIHEQASAAQRKKMQQKNRDQLQSAARALAHNATLCQELHQQWDERWQQDDQAWQQRLLWCKNWILPCGHEAITPAIRHVGGLSLTRLATITELRRKLLVGFETRLKPDGSRQTLSEQFEQKALDTLEQLREQRVKQLASRIVEAALGVGRLKREQPQQGHFSQESRRPLPGPEQPDQPCHAVIIENLTRYRPEETRTRRENRQIMTWSAAKVEKYLEESCQLNGLHLREVSAGYTSRQDSRTGAPGLRCQDVPVCEFMKSRFWRKQVSAAQQQLKESKGNARDRLLDDLDKKWHDKETEWDQSRPIRIPQSGGELFVSADGDSPASKGLQADLNAAANIGLRALLDPDWPGRWWYVPCDAISYKPYGEKTKGSATITTEPLVQLPDSPRRQKVQGSRSAAGKEIVNLWRDVSSQPITADHGPWQLYTAYQNQVQQRVINILRAAMGLLQDG
ncbi:MAG: type V CRISPR-associated protein Cas12b [Magnetococcales bacterium]|nr:type V CRISPR-associated protein Cas12b [Magnetococcales bacterium]